MEALKSYNGSTLSSCSNFFTSSDSGFNFFNGSGSGLGSGFNFSVALVLISLGIPAPAVAPALFPIPISSMVPVSTPVLHSGPDNIFCKIRLCDLALTFHYFNKEFVLIFEGCSNYAEQLSDTSYLLKRRSCFVLNNYYFFVHCTVCTRIFAQSLFKLIWFGICMLVASSIDSFQIVHFILQIADDMFTDTG